MACVRSRRAARTYGDGVPPESLTDRMPAVQPARALADLVVPPSFAGATLANFLPDPAHPTQAAARDAVAAFAVDVGTATPGGGQARRRGLLRRPVPRTGTGIYLDGGFGVGKTHLLAAAAHAAVDSAAHPPGQGGRVAFGTFMQYTALVGALGFAATRNALATMALVCIDEFELDDPGDTVMMSTLLGALAQAGVYLAATSNTLPGALGAERFAAEDFVREIQGLADRFSVLHVDGPDYRHRENTPRAGSIAAADLVAWATANDACADDFGALITHLGRVHPAAYGELVDGVRAVAWRDVETIEDQNAALRLVVLVDRLYDRGIPIAASGTTLPEVFGPQLLAGGYRLKYGRARSRLAALAAVGARPDFPTDAGPSSLPNSDGNAASTPARRVDS